jgi:hypothetical protein
VATLPDESSPYEVINASLRAWRQGDCVLGEHWFTWRYDPDAPITITSNQEGFISDDTDILEEACPGLAVVSQTCDIIRNCQERPFIEVCPLLHVEAEEMPLIRRGKRPSYGYLPGIESHNLVVDLNRVMTLEKPVLAKLERVAGCSSDADKRSFAEALARKRQRFAFPDEFTNFVRPFNERMKRKHNKKSHEGEALRQLREVRVLASPSWIADSVEIFLYFIIDENADLSGSVNWAHLLEKWLDLFPVSDKFVKVEGGVFSLSDMTASEYVCSDRLDFDHLSLANDLAVSLPGEGAH